MKVILLLAAILIIPGLISNGCASDSAAAVSLSGLVANPEEYNGKTVTVEGIYIHGWEWIVLAEGVAFIGEGNLRELKPVGEAIWFAGLMPAEVWEKLYKHESPGAGTQRYGKVRITGVFEYGGKYGHMNAYKHRITASEVISLDWTPPE